LGAYSFQEYFRNQKPSKGARLSLIRVNGPPDDDDDDDDDADDGLSFFPRELNQTILAH
jgi:hypothetical protein